ncbi:LemA family protein [Comamonas fluminis]|uniref:LemA family protein n=1 Tax=Comamonas fluminis TaxID=2796366 RepID=UPI001C45F52D|nr:LemA family protein [Comamonas fluminis]
MGYFALVAVVLVVLLVWVVAVYNRLRTHQNRVENAFAQIDVQLKRRHDLIPNLVEVARGYMQHEAQTLEAVIRARGEAVSAADRARQSPGKAQAMGALMAAEQVLGGQMGRLMALAEAYPTLKADARMQQLSEEITSTENRIGFARQAYNDGVLDFNNQAGRFPDLIVARLAGFVHMDMLASTQNEQERAAPKVKF